MLYNAVQGTTCKEGSMAVFFCLDLLVTLIQKMFQFGRNPAFGHQNITQTFIRINKYNSILVFL